MALLSPGVEVKEIDLSIVVPTVGNAIACFAGVFQKGPIDMYLAIQDVDQFIDNYGHPTNDNYNDWFQVYNFLQYGDNILVSRAADVNGTYFVDKFTNDSGQEEANKVSAVDVDKVTFDNLPDYKVGNFIRKQDSTDNYKVLTITQVDTDDGDGNITTTYDVTLDTTTDLTTVFATGDIVEYQSAITNALAEAKSETGTASTDDELRLARTFIPNKDVYEYAEQSIVIGSGSKIKFIAKDAGSYMNDVQVAIAREADFSTGTTDVFPGINLNGLFENTPSEAKEEIAVVVKKGSDIQGTYIVSLKEGAKDYRNKSYYIEDIFYSFDPFLYAKVNQGVQEMPASALGTETVKLGFGTDGKPGADDIANAYGSVSSNTIFGNKEELDVDIVIGNEKARVAAASLATDRGDCISFLAASYDEVVGLKSTEIVQNLINTVLNGELAQGSVVTSFNAYFGNYKQQYDKYNDKMRWVSIAGDVAGLRAETNSNRDSWWASAGIERGQIKNAQKLFFNPNQGQRDLLYKNKVNPVVSFPGLGNAIVWGQKTLQAKPSSFDRINVRGLFNTLERAIGRMAKFYLFEFNDEFTRNRFISTIKPFLEEVKAGRGVYDYYIRCDSTNNTPQVIDTNRFIADIAVKPTRVAEFITLNFIAVGTGVQFKEIFA